MPPAESFANALRPCNIGAMPRYEGLIAAAHSPFAPQGDLNLAVVEKQAALLLEQEVAAVFPCGSTGESASLTVPERKQLARRWKDVVGERLPVIVHVGHNSHREAADLAAHAQEISAAGIAALAPSYFKPATVDDLVEFLAPIAAAAPALPFYFYDIPSMTGVQLPTDQFLEKAGRRIPNLAGVKFTSSDLMALQGCLAAAGGKYEILFGSDEILLAALALGARGAIGSTYNYAAPVYHRVIEAFARGDMATARREQFKSVEVVRVLNKFGGLRTGKAIMSFLGADCGPVRPPLRPLTADETAAIFDHLAPLAEIFPRPLRRG